MKVNILHYEINPDPSAHFVGQSNLVAGPDSFVACQVDYDPDAQSKEDFCQDYLEYLRTSYRQTPEIKLELDKLSEQLNRVGQLTLTYSSIQEEWCAQVLSGVLHKLATKLEGSKPVAASRKFRVGDWVTGVAGRASHGWFGIVEDVTVIGYDHINQCDRILYYVDWYERHLNEDLDSAVISAPPEHIQIYADENPPTYRGEPGANERKRRRRNPRTSFELWMQKKIEPGTGNMSKKQKSRSKKK